MPRQTAGKPNMRMRACLCATTSWRGISFEKKFLGFTGTVVGELLALGSVGLHQAVCISGNQSTSGGVGRVSNLNVMRQLRLIQTENAL